MRIPHPLATSRVGQGDLGPVDGVVVALVLVPTLFLGRFAPPLLILGVVVLGVYGLVRHIGLPSRCWIVLGRVFDLVNPLDVEIGRLQCQGLSDADARVVDEVVLERDALVREAMTSSPSIRLSEGVQTLRSVLASVASPRAGFEVGRELKEALEASEAERRARDELRP